MSSRRFRHSHTLVKTSFRLLAGAALLVELLVVPAFAADSKEHKLSEWKFGKVLFGEKVSKGDLKGKVVVVENWGVHCPPCIASLPHLAAMEKSNRDKGLVIIGAESQGSSKDAIKPLIEKAGVEYTITEGAEGPIEVTGIPRAFVFDATGKLVYDGNPLGKEFEESVTKALSTVTVAEPAAAAAPAASTGPLIAMQAWTNSDGREIKAAVKKVDGSNVTFQMADGREVTYPLAKLSTESRGVIEAAAKKP